LHSKELVRMLNHPELKPFWNDVQRFRDAHMKGLVDDEDVSYAKAVKVLDRILGLPAFYEKSVDNKNEQ
jgi:hypothetical protein